MGARPAVPATSLDRRTLREEVVVVLALSLLASILAEDKIGRLEKNLVETGIATGASAKYLGLPSEEAFAGRGVSACATCDGFFFRGQTIAVIGGGDSAVEEATFLTRLAEQVYLVHRRDELRASKIMQERAFNNPKISVRWNSQVTKLVGDKKLESIEVTDTVTGAVERIALSGLFVAIGHNPATEIFRGQIDMDEEGYIRTAPDSTRTSVPGVFAAGDVKDKVFRQAVTAAGMGCMAALEAERYLAHIKNARPRFLPP